MAGKTTIEITGGKKLDAFFRGAGKGGVEGVRVGFFASAKYDDGTPVAAVAAWNEFGTKKPNGSQHIPERPFFRNAIENAKSEVLDLLKAEMNPKVMAVTPLLANRIGAKVQGGIQQEIARLRQPPNAPTTTATKGSSSPLIDTGFMRASVTYEVER